MTTGTETAQIVRAVSAAVEAICIQSIMLQDGDLPAARELNRTANDSIQRAARLLRVIAGPSDPAPMLAPSPLELRDLDTPDTRELLDLLQRAQAVAERVDLARGRVVSPFVPLAPGEPRGTDWAESVGELALRLRIEVEGPKGLE